jgi:voltage-gated potassium channel
MRKTTLKLLKTLLTKIVTSGLILIIALFIYGIVGSYFIMGLNIIDSIYYSVITMATVGYGDYIPTTGIQKIFATTLALGGVALLAYVFNIILTNVQERMSEYSKGARKMKKIENMDDYYILCGFGRVGKVVFEELSKRNQNVIIYEKNEEICEDIEENESVVVLNKDATQSELISQLAGEKCRSVIISTGDDVANLFIVLAIRESNPDAWIVSRASKEENYSRLRKAGADKIVSPELIGGKDLYLESTKPHILKITIRHGVDEIYDEFGPEEFDEPDLNFYSRAAGFDAEIEEYEMDEDRYVAPPRKRGFRRLVVFALVQAFVVIALALWWLGRLL